MSETDSPGSPDGDLLDAVRSVLSSHPLSIVMAFGSAVTDPDAAEDLDLAVEFEDLRPGDEGYSTAYLRLRSDLNDALPVDVDVVDVHAMDPRFAGSVFDHAEVIVGSERRRRELEDELPIERPSRSEARERIANAAERLRDGTST